MAAHQFLERNDLSQMFLDQVADFILKNTKGVTIGQQTPAAGDPFTGMKLLTPSASPLGCAVSSAHVSILRAENRELRQRRRLRQRKRQYLKVFAFFPRYFQLAENVKYRLISRLLNFCSRAVTAKKCTKKVCCTCRVVVLPLLSSDDSQSSDFSANLGLNFETFNASLIESDRISVLSDQNYDLARLL